MPIAGEKVNMVSDIREKIKTKIPGAVFQNFEEDDMQAKLLAFWTRHPKAKLSLSAVKSSENNNALRRAILSLVGEGILEIENTREGLITYGLSKHYSTH